MENLRYIVFALIAGILAIVFWPGGGESLPPIDVQYGPKAVHPPADVAVRVNQGEWPAGSTFVIYDGAKALTAPRAEIAGTLGVDEWPVDLSVVGTHDGKECRAAIDLELINEPPVFHNLFIDELPEAREWVGLWWYYREHGCDVSGKPTAITGIKDPDQPGDETDGWRYRCAVEIMDGGNPTGVYEPLWYCYDGEVRAISPDQWIEDPRYVWVPFATEQPPGLACSDFPPPQRGDLSTMSLDELPGGYAVAPYRGGVATMSCCGPVLSPDPLEPGEPNRLIHVWVMEYGAVYHETYAIHAVGASCE